MEKAEARILVVEDQEGWQRHLAIIIGRMGHMMRGAYTRFEARRLIREDHFVAGIFDVHLPDGYGIDLVPEFKSRNPTARALVCSGYACVTASQLAYAAGADLFAESTRDNIESFLRGEALHPSVTRPTLEQVKDEYVNKVLLEVQGNRSVAADLLGIRRQSLQRLLRRKRTTGE